MQKRTVLIALVVVASAATWFVLRKRSEARRGAAHPGPTAKWTLKLGGVVTSGGPRASPVTVPLAVGVDGTVYVRTDMGDLKAVDPSGSILWTRPVERGHAAPAVASDGAVYVLAVGKLFVFNRNGSPRTERVMNTYAMASGVSLTDHRLFAECVRGGACSWTLDPVVDAVWHIESSQFLAPPLLHCDGTVVWGGSTVVAVSGNILPELRWSVPTGNTLKPDEERPNSYAVWGRTGLNIQGLAAGRDGVTYVADEDKILAVGPNGEEMWEVPARPAAKQQPVVAADGTVYFNTQGRLLYAVRSDGTKRWTLPTTGSTGQPLLGSAGTIFFTDSTKLRAVDPDGHERWTADLDFAVQGSLTLSTDGTLYVATLYGTLYAFPVGETLMRSTWPKFQGNVRNSGQESCE